MEKENLFDGEYWITATVVIPADRFAKEILGEDPEPQKIAEFIKDHASLMEVVYGTPRIAPAAKVRFDMLTTLKDIDARLYRMEKDMDYIYDKLITKAAAEEVSPPKKPWYKRIFGN